MIEKACRFEKVCKTVAERRTVFDSVQRDLTVKNLGCLNKVVSVQRTEALPWSQAE